MAKARAPRRPEVLALIPARAGSKRVKNKNIRDLGGKPLIAYTIEAALKARSITRVVVSTDSPAIARIAKKHGADVPFLRPKDLAGSHSTEYEFHRHALDWLKENEGYAVDLVVNLYPTTPFRKSASIDRAVRDMLSNPKAESLRSIRKCAEHPYKMWTVKGKMALPYVGGVGSQKHTLAYQQLPEIWIQNASIYITRPNVIYQSKSTIGKRVLAFPMTEEESVDINLPLDFVLAETLLRDKTG